MVGYGCLQAVTYRLGILRPKLNLQNLNKPMNYLYTNRRSVGIFGGLLLLILFSCCGIGRAAAQQQGAEQRITLSMRDTAISDILENITKRYQYAFITRTANVDTNARVSIDVVDEPLRAVLDRIFAGQEVAFEFDGRL